MACVMLIPTTVSRMNGSTLLEGETGWLVTASAVVGERDGSHGTHVSTSVFSFLLAFHLLFLAIV